jgi:hypothetical protein
MEFHDEFSEAVIDEFQLYWNHGYSIWDFGPMFCMGGEL